MSPALFEIRLVGCHRIFWSTITPSASGCLKILSAPEFLQHTGFRNGGDEGMDGQWDLWPIDNPARPHSLRMPDQLCQPIHVTDRTLGIALISLQRNDEHSPGWLWLELFLSAREPAQNGRSILEDWTELLRSNKDDESKQVVLRLDFGVITMDKIACFKSQRKLVTSNVTLEIRPHHATLHGG
jgi:hypothetical protein